MYEDGLENRGEGRGMVVDGGEVDRDEEIEHSDDRD